MAVRSPLLPWLSMTRVGVVTDLTSGSDVVSEMTPS